MGTNKSRSRGNFAIAAQIARLLVAAEYRGLVLSAALVIAAVGLTCYGWQRWGAATLDSPDYTVTPEKIHVTPQPAWIHTSIKSEVLRTARATSLNLHDPSLVEHLAQAF